MLLIVLGLGVLLLLGLSFAGYKYIPAIKNTFVSSCSDVKYHDILKEDKSQLTCATLEDCTAFANGYGVENAPLRCNDGKCQINDALCFTGEVTQ